MKWIACLIFIAYIKTPFGFENIYRDIVSYRLEATSIILMRQNGAIIVAPALFTVLEEKLK